MHIIFKFIYISHVWGLAMRSDSDYTQELSWADAEVHESVRARFTGAQSVRRLVEATARSSN